MKEEIAFFERMVAILHAQSDGKATFANQGQAMDGYSALANYNGLAKEVDEYLEEL